jgi:hypothetical protein
MPSLMAMLKMLRKHPPNILRPTLTVNYVQDSCSRARRREPIVTGTTPSTLDSSGGHTRFYHWRALARGTTFEVAAAVCCKSLGDLFVSARFVSSVRVSTPSADADRPIHYKPGPYASGLSKSPCLELSFTTEASFHKHQHLMPHALGGRERIC